MQTFAFGYKCQECGQGKVVERVFQEYKTKVKGLPLTVQNARIGVCDRCGAQHFDANETARWRSLFEEERSSFCLGPEEIRELRNSLGLGMEQFSVLLGCTRQSLHNWERRNRQSPQSRMADVFMRLIQESHRVGQVDVLSFLKAEAAKLGSDLKTSLKREPIAPIVTVADKRPSKSNANEASETLELAADTQPSWASVVLKAENGQPIGNLAYDYRTASLNLVFSCDVQFVRFDAEIELSNGTAIPVKGIEIKDHEAVLLSGTRYTQEEVARVQISPLESVSTGKADE